MKKLSAGMPGSLSAIEDAAGAARNMFMDKACSHALRDFGGIGISPLPGVGLFQEEVTHFSSVRLADEPLERADHDRPVRRHE